MGCTESKKNREVAVPQPQPQQVDDRDMTILKLKVQRDKMLAQRRALETNSDRAHVEAKQYVQKKQKERAMFCLKRKKLYENMLNDVQNQYAIIEKMVSDVESRIQLAEFTKALKDTNNLIKELDSASHYEELLEIQQDIRTREEATRQFNQMCDEHNVQDSEVDKMFAEFENMVLEEDKGIKISGIQGRNEAPNFAIEPNLNIMNQNQQSSVVRNSQALSSNKRMMELA